MLFENYDFSKSKNLKQLPLYCTMSVKAALPSLFPKYVVIDDAVCDLASSSIKSDRSHGRKCDVFGEYLVYLFYGRPAFQWEDKGIRNNIYPACFQIAPQDIIPRRIFPFDSGAFDGNYYNKPILNYSGELTDYQLYDNDGSKEIGMPSDQIPRLIYTLWESNVNYYNGAMTVKASENVITKTLSKFDKEYLAFIDKKAYSHIKEGGDTRAFTIEYQICGEVSLQNVERIILPNHFKGSQKATIRKLFYRMCKKRVKIEYYNHPGSVNGAFEQISALCSDTVVAR